MGRGRNTGLRRMGLLLLVFLVASIRAEAHDLERTTVHLQLLADGSFSLRLAHDPSWLLLRMESFAGGAETSTTDPSARDARLRALAPQMIDRVVLFVDGREVRPESAEYAPPPESVPPGEFALASYTLRGRLPASASRLRWYYGMVIDPYPFTVQLANGSSNTELVQGDAWSTTLPLGGPFVPPALFARARAYLGLGFAHMLPRGVDHILFVIGLFLLSGRVRPVLAQVTAFTAAHAVASALSMYGVVSLPVRIVEPLMALSVVYVAVDNLKVRTTAAVRTALICAFGAVHGIGLAGGLATSPAARADVGAVLIGVNGGVELAQLSVVLAASILLAGSSGHVWYRSRVVVPASLTIAAVGVCWTVLQVMQ